MTQDNCRLLLVRLKMEGYVIGKSKVFLRYYNEEYMSRLYETQVKKIVKVQCMLRSFLARKAVNAKTTRNRYAARSGAAPPREESGRYTRGVWFFTIATPLSIRCF